MGAARRGGAGLTAVLSRVAENLYWLGRNLERAENIARMAEVAHSVSVEAGGAGPGSDQVADAVIDAIGAHEQFEAIRAADPSASPAEFLLLSHANPYSLRSTVVHARGLARELREQLSREVWEQINGVYLEVQGANSVSGGAVTGFSDSVRNGVAAVLGLFDNTVLRDEGRDWFRCGVFLERADMTSRIVDAKYFVLLPPEERVGGSVDRLQWVSVLRSASALQAFRSARRGVTTGAGVASMLVLSEDFPRSLRFCVRAFRRHYEAATARTPAGQTVHAARELALLDLDLAAMNEASLIRQGLHEFLDDFQARLIGVDGLLHEHIFRVLPSVA